MSIVIQFMISLIISAYTWGTKVVLGDMFEKKNKKKP